MDLSRVHDPQEFVVNRTELDSHADTCVAGANTVPLWYADCQVCVSPFIGEYQPLTNVPIASVATAWDHPETGETYLLIINEALYFGDRMNHSLLCPNQLRDFGIRVHDVPTQYDPNSSHSIYIPDSDLELPLQMRGVFSYLETRKPFDDELVTCQRIELTSASPWDPDLASRGEVMDLHRERPRDFLRPDASPPELMVDVLPRLISAINICEPKSNPIVERHEADVIAHDVEMREVGAVQAAFRTPSITFQELAARWHIGLDTAKATLKATTQEGMRFVEGDLERRLRTSRAHLRFPTLNCTIYSDTLFSKHKSVRGFNCAQVFTDGKGFYRLYPMKRKGEAYHALSQFIHDVGIPKNCLVDMAKEERDGEWGRIVKHYHIKLRTTEAYSPWQNRAESAVRELKKLSNRALRRSGAPTELWCYAMEWAARTMSLTAHNLPALKTRTPEEALNGQTPDISEFANHSFFEWIWYRDLRTYPEPSICLGRWVGVASDVGQPMTYWILTEKCTIIARSSVKSLQAFEKLDAVIISQQEAFMRSIYEQKALSSDFSSPWITADDKEPDDDVVPDWEAEAYTTPEADAFTPESYDEYLSAQVTLPVGGEVRRGQVVRRKRDHNGRPVGVRNSNPILDTREYEVEFPDGTTQSYAANVIAENLYSQVDEEGKSYSILSEIVGHDKDSSAMTIEQLEASGKPCFTTVGWRLLVSWKDGTSSYVPLREMKDAFPVEVAEYATASMIAKEPAFRWWVPFVLKKRDRIISKITKGKGKYWTRTHKYGIELPKTVAEALDIDRRTGTTFWREAIEKEMKNVSVAFKFNDDDSIPIGYKHITCHMVFEIKMVGLVRKARLVAGGHLTDPPVDSVYSSVVTRESVRIMFTIAALNDLSLIGADVQNAYINAPTKEKVYTTAGLEFGSNAGRPAIIVRALYGLKSSGARWRDHLAGILRTEGFQGSLADPDVWMRKARKPCGFTYWEYLLAYVDDILIISHQPHAVIDALSQHVTFKPGSVEPPKSYLGADVFQITVHDGNGDTPVKQVWCMSAGEYVKRAIEEVERELAMEDSYLPKRVETPLSSGYRPELDFSLELDGAKVNYYQGLIGILRWIVELGRIDLIVPVSLLSRFMMSPREGHLQQCYHIFAYLKQFNRSRLVFDDAVPDLSDKYFHVCDWSEYYPDAAEAVPRNIPEALGCSVTTTCFVDADHAGCKVTRRSQTGLIIYVNKAPVFWFSKRQNTVESSTFGSEFIALKTAIDQIEAIRYKLRMFGIPLDGATSIICDNESVVRNTTHSESTLRRKHLSIAYHRCREAIAAGYVRVAWELGEFNPADILTKLLAGPRMRALLRQLFYWNKPID